MSSLARPGRTLSYFPIALSFVIAAAAAVLLTRLATSSLNIGGNAATRIWPGVKVPLDITFTNTYDFDVSVTNLRVTVRDVHAPHADAAHGCGIANFAVDQVSPNLKVLVTSGSTRSFSAMHLPVSDWPRVQLLDQSANRVGCQGASLTLRYSATRTLKLP